MRYYRSWAVRFRFCTGHDLPVQATERISQHHLSDRHFVRCGPRNGDYDTQERAPREVAEPTSFQLERTSGHSHVSCLISLWKTCMVDVSLQPWV